MKAPVPYRLLFFLLTGSVCCPAQQNVDSLFRIINTNQEDTARINTLNLLAYEFRNNDPDTSVYFSKQALDLARKLDDKEGEATACLWLGTALTSQGEHTLAFEQLSLAEKISLELLSADSQNEAEKFRIQRLLGRIYNNTGIVFQGKGEYERALDYYLKSVSLKEKLGLVKEMPASYGNMGNIFMLQGNYPKALEYFFKLLKISEELGNRNMRANTLANIGSVYHSLNEPEKSLKYFLDAMKLQEELKDKYALAVTCNNAGLIYYDRSEHTPALDYFTRSLSLSREVNNKNTEIIALGNIGNVYRSKNEIERSLEYYLQALTLSEQLGDKNNLSIWLGSIGNLYAGMGKYSEAESNLKKALGYAEETGSMEWIRENHKFLSELYSKTGKYEPALTHYKAYVAARDRVFNEENTKKAVRSEMNFQFEKKEAIAKAEHEKQAAVAAAENRRQQLVIWSTVTGLLLVAAFAGFIFRSLRITNRQKMIIEEKNKDISDSINYAKRIQDALLSQREVKYRLFPDAFVLFRPKDVVSGDFYWFTEKNGRRMIAAVDCTGHGVPGAFMSMIGNTFLNEIADERGITQPDAVLNELRDMIIKTLKQSGGESKDGMDIALLSFDDRNNTVEFAGANNPLWHIRNGKLTEIRPNKQPIGYHSGAPSPFTLHRIELQKGDTLYIFSDGFADQFGGPKGKKFKYKQLQEVLLSVQQKPMLRQEEILLDHFQRWTGNLEQVDDVLVIGIRI